MKKAARTAVRGRSRRLPVPPAEPHRRGEGHHRPAEERHLRVLRPDQPQALADGEGSPGTDMILRVRAAHRRAAGQPRWPAACWCSPSWPCCPGTLPGWPWGSTPLTRRSPSSARQFGLDRPLVAQYLARWWAGPAVRPRRTPTSPGRRSGRRSPTGSRSPCGSSSPPWSIALVDRGAVRDASWLCGTASRPGWLFSAVSQARVAVPAFLAGILLITVFAVKLGWLPANGWTPPSAGSGPCSSSS